MNEPLLKQTDIKEILSQHNWHEQICRLKILNKISNLNEKPKIEQPKDPEIDQIKSNENGHQINTNNATFQVDAKYEGVQKYQPTSIKNLKNLTRLKQYQDDEDMDVDSTLDETIEESQKPITKLSPLTSKNNVSLSIRKADGSLEPVKVQPVLSENKNINNLPTTTNSISNIPKPKPTTPEIEEKPSVSRSGIVRRKAIIYEDHSDDSENEYSNQMDVIKSSDYDEITKFLNKGTFDELCAAPGISEKKADIFISLRPFKSFRELNQKIAKYDKENKSRGSFVSQNVWDGVHKLLVARKTLATLLNKCRTISNRIKMQVSGEGVPVEDRLKEPPRCIQENASGFKFGFLGIRCLWESTQFFSGLFYFFAYFLFLP